MKISINLKQLDRWGDEKYKKLREIGFEAIDFSSPLTMGHKEENSEKFLAAVMREKELIDAANLEIYQFHGPWRYPPRDKTDKDRAERLEKMQTSIKACAALGCKNWVIHPIMPFGCEDISLGKQEETLKINLEFFGELAKTAKSEGVNICLENMPMPQFSISTPKDILKAVKLLDDDCFKICLDIGHIAVFKDIRIDNAIRDVKDYLVAIHAHDNMGKDDEHLIPHFGIIDWNKVGKALREIDYKGSFSLETNIPQGLSDKHFDELVKLTYSIAEEIANQN